MMYNWKPKPKKEPAPANMIGVQGSPPSPPKGRVWLVGPPLGASRSLLGALGRSWVLLGALGRPHLCLLWIFHSFFPPRFFNAI